MAGQLSPDQLSRVASFFAKRPITVMKGGQFSDADYAVGELRLSPRDWQALRQLQTTWNPRTGNVRTPLHAAIFAHEIGHFAKGRLDPVNLTEEDEHAAHRWALNHMLPVVQKLGLSGKAAQVFARQAKRDYRAYLRQYYGKQYG